MPNNKDLKHKQGKEKTSLNAMENIGYSHVKE